MRGKSIMWMTIAFAMLLSSMPLAIPVAVAESTPHVYIDPAMVTPEVGTQFTVNIKIAGIIDNDIYTWGLRLSWDPIMIDFVSAVEGPYLAEVAPEGTFFIVGELPPTREYVDLACTILGPYAGASGDGTLVSVTFNVLDIGATTLHLSDIQLVDSGLHLKPYTSAGGTVDVHSDWLSNPSFYAILVVAFVPTRHWSLKIQGTTICLYAKIKNLAWVPLWVKARFAGMTPIGPRTCDTEVVLLQPNEVSGFLTCCLVVPPGTYVFHAYAMYSYGGFRWFVDYHKVKSVTFVVVDC